MTLSLSDMVNLKPNSSFQNLCHVDAGAGSGLTAGLRKYNLLFIGHYTKLYAENKRAAVTALKIVKFVLDLFICPILGTLALLGVGINAIHVRLNNHSFHSTLKKALQSSNTVTKIAKSLYENHILILHKIKSTLADLNQEIKQVSRRGLFIAKGVVGNATSLSDTPKFYTSISTVEATNQDSIKRALMFVNPLTK